MYGIMIDIAVASCVHIPYGLFVSSQEVDIDFPTFDIITTWLESNNQIDVSCSTL